MTKGDVISYVDIERFFFLGDWDFIESRFFDRKKKEYAKSLIDSGKKLKFKLQIAMEEQHPDIFKIDVRLYYTDPKTYLYIGGLNDPAIDGDFIWKLAPDLRMLRFLQCPGGGNNMEKLGMSLGAPVWEARKIGYQFSKELYDDYKKQRIAKHSNR